MNLQQQKSEIIQWISSIEDPKTIEQIDQFRKQKLSNFQEALKTAITGDELKKRTTKFLESLEWKR